MRRHALGTAAPWEDMRAQLAQATSRFELPEGMSTRDHKLAGVPALTIGTEEQLAASRRILHLHGGGYTLGSPATTLPVTAGFAAATDTAVTMLDYRLAPEHPFPAALDDATAALRAIIDEAGDPGLVAVSGDSAGGGLALAITMRLRDEGGLLPAAVIGFSPWLDLSLSSEAPDPTRLVDPQVSFESLSRMAEAYLNGESAVSPMVSPLFGALDDMPPILVQVGTHEYLREDAFRFLAAASRQQADVTVEVFTGMVHVWHSLAPRLEAANSAHVHAAEWLRTSAHAFA